MTGYRTCSVEGCHRKHIARGLCHTHYGRWRRQRDISDPEFVNKGKICSIEGCESDAKEHGMCFKHARRIDAHGDPHHTENVRWEGMTCVMSGCPHEVRLEQLCHNHYHNYLYHKKRQKLNNVFDYIRFRNDNPGDLRFKEEENE